MASIRTDTRITRQNLRQIADRVAHNLPDGPHPQDLLLKVSYEALIRLFGVDWMHQNMPRNGRGYLMPADNTERAGHIAARRVIRLVEQLLNFQEMASYPDGVAEFNRSGIEVGMYGFEIARFLRETGLDFSFIQRSKTVKTPDFALAHGTGEIIIEAKSIKENTLIAAKTLARPLRDAIGQLTGNGPHVIIVRVPPKWTSENGDFVRSVIENFLETAPDTVVRIAAIADPPGFDEASMLNLAYIIDVINRKPRFGSSFLNDVFVSRLFPEHWTTLAEAVGLRKRPNADLLNEARRQFALGQLNGDILGRLWATTEVQPLPWWS